MSTHSVNYATMTTALWRWYCRYNNNVVHVILLPWQQQSCCHYENNSDGDDVTMIKNDGDAAPVSTPVLILSLWQQWQWHIYVTCSGGVVAMTTTLVALPICQPWWWCCHNDHGLVTLPFIWSLRVTSERCRMTALCDSLHLMDLCAWQK